MGNENIRRFIGQLNHVIRVRSSEFFHCSVGGDFGGEWQECQFADAGTMYATSEMLNQVQVHTNNRWVGQTPWCKLMVKGAVVAVLLIDVGFSSLTRLWRWHLLIRAKPSHVSSHTHVATMISKWVW